MSREESGRNPLEGLRELTDRASFGPLRRGSDQPTALYVHIPFCVKKCPYCDFVSGPVGLALRGAHLAALCREIRCSPWSGASPETVFFGGGTPSELTLKELESVTTALRESFDLSGAAEWTIECNPGTARPDKLEGMRRLGFNRISLGAQSFHDRHLQTLGRVHGARQARQSYRWARRAGFDNVNLDLIFAVPGQSLAEWENDLDEALAMGPEHLSLYNLTVEPGTEFGERAARGDLAEVDEDLAADMFELAMDRTRQAGLVQYEISNYARRGFECRHNWAYWRRLPYLSFGLGAVSFMNGVRWTNTCDFQVYADRVEADQLPENNSETLNAADSAAEAVMLGLRTREGVGLGDVKRKHGFDLLRSRAEALEFLLERRLLLRRADRLRLSRRGKMVANQVCAELFP